MADVAASVRQYLVANAGVSALVPGSRFWPDKPPQGYKMSQGAAVIYSKLSTIHDHMLNGLAGIARCRIEYTAYSSTRAGANAVAEAVRNSGIVGFTGTTYGVTIESVMLENGEETEDEFPINDGSQEHRYLTTFDFLIAYQEEVA